MKPLRSLAPYLPVFILATALYFIGDQFPFSNFPMYSNLPEGADGVFVTTEKGEFVPMTRTFNVSSQTSRKMFTRELKTILKARGEGDTKMATETEVQRAAQIVLTELVRRGRDRKFGKSTATAFTFNRRFYLREGKTLSYKDATNLATIQL